MKNLLAQLEKHHLLIFIILAITFVLRFPSLFEPFWYGDEGIFAAVARNLNFGGTLYQTAWDNKPPMIYLTYATIFHFLGVSMFWLRLVASIVVVITAGAIYEIGRLSLGRNRALVAALLFGILTSLRLIEGNLALTEIFMILPITLAMLVVIYRKFDFVSLFFSGILFAVASLFKQVGAFEAAALGLYVFFITPSLIVFIKKGTALTVGFSIPFIITVGYFSSKGLLSEYIYAAYTYYQMTYLQQSPQYAILINIAKYLPFVSIVAYSLYRKIRKLEVGYFHLFLLWLSLSFLGSYFSGRTYGHYLVQAVPALSLILASIRIKWPSITRAGAIFAVVFLIPIIFLTRLLFSDFLSGGPLNQVKYWQNFISFASGQKTIDSYNNYFDWEVNTIMSLEDSLKMNKATGESIYIWGEYAWLYAITDAKNPSRYVTSFHVFEVESRKAEVMKALVANKPKYIIKPERSSGYFADLEKLLVTNYTSFAKINTAEVFVLKAN